MCEHCEKLPDYPDCFVCGKENPKGLQLNFYYDKEKEIVETKINIGKEYIGFTDIVHGGIISTVLDETSAWAAMKLTGEICVTSKLNIEFLLPAKPDKEYIAIAYKPMKKEKSLEIKSEFIDSRNRIIAKANAVFIIMTGKRAEKIKQDINL